LILFAVPGPDEVAQVIKGSFDIGTQYHFTMETQQCVCVPTEDGMDVYPSSQWMDHVQVGISEALDIPENRYVLRSGNECFRNS
jgi:xanthine dehydrogenase/oxidase